MTKNLDIEALKNLPMDELRKVMGELSHVVEDKQQAEKQIALNQIKALVIEHDLPYEDVVETIRTAAKRGKAPPIYRNPENARQTWSGKGEAPDWFSSHPDPETLRIPGA